MHHTLRIIVSLLVASCSPSSSRTTADSGTPDTAIPIADSGPDAAGPGDVSESRDLSEMGTAGLCDPSIGLREPTSYCSPTNPCENIATGDVAGRRDRPSDVPTCASTATATADGRGAFDDGPPATFTDRDGVTRYWCEYVPPAAGAANRMPVLVFLHGSGGVAQTVYNSTLLRQKANDTPFILVSLQARNLHVPTLDRTDTSKWDEFHRDFASPSGNRDLEFIDHVIDSLADVADPNRIYISGWSNGGFMAQLYAIARHETATPGGHRVAAAAVFSAADPFHHVVAVDDTCRLDPYPPSNVPIMLVSRACDIVACDEAQATQLRDDGIGVPPGRIVEPWIADATALGANIEWRRVSGLFEIAGRIVDQCSANCPAARATINHIRWPDGIADESGTDHEPDMLQFLFDHPLP